ncbi:MAG: Beta-galactosidase/beta-glucuronidase domain protein [Bacteroidetes bacterium]|nr:Beta-galactosidase/beta-glucuronidase domain protein [Bacteroidota bacterium]
MEGGPSGAVKIPSAYDFIGKVVFERNFEITAEQVDKFQFFLAMFGVNHSCEVALNGDFITTHAGGYTSFIQPIPGNTLQVGKENVIKVAVNNELDPRKTLPLRSNVWGWRNYGGILRDVFIMAVPKIAISDVVVSSKYSADNGTSKVSVDAMFEGLFEQSGPVVGAAKGSTSLGMYVEMLDKITGFLVAKSSVVQLTQSGNEWDSARAEMTVGNTKLWSPDSPELYLVKVYLVQGGAKDLTIVDEYDLNHGIRDLEIANGNILLNGKRVVLKGLVWYEDHPNFGSAMSYEELERDVALIKGLGANTIRFGNHPPHPYMLNLCDRYGLFALEELPLSGTPSSVLDEEYYIELAGTMMREMIARDRQHVSVLAWGIGDEFESSTPSARNFVEGLVRLAKSLDSRPTYLGTRLIESDVCADLVDIAAVDVRVSDIKAFKKRLEGWKARNQGRPVIVGKFGTEVQHNNRNGYSDPLSYEAQARFYIQRFDIVKNLDYDGAMIWSFNDWKGDRPSLTVNAGDPWMHSMGLVSYEREKRLAYDAVRSIFRGEKFVALPMGNYAASAPIIFVVSGLIVLIGTAYFYNANRRFRDNLNRSVMNLYNFFADVRDQRIVSLVQTTILGLIISVATAIVVSSVLYHFRQSWVLDNLLSYLLVSDGLKESVVLLVWNPIKCIAYFSAFCFLVLVSVYVLVMLLSVISKAKIFSYHAYVITIWSATPLLILVPIGMILYRIMDSPMYVVPSLVLLAVLFLWVLLRILKGISIIFDAYLVKVYVIGFVSLAGVVTMVYTYFDYTQSTSMYLSYMYHVMMNSQ